MGIKAKLIMAYSKEADKNAVARFAMHLLGLDASDKEDTGWRTTENGKHYHIDPEGNVDKGPKAMVGTNVNEPDTWDNPKPAKSERFIKGAYPALKSMTEKAKKHPDNYNEWISELTSAEYKAIDDNFDAMREAEQQSTGKGEWESRLDYYERIHRMLVAHGDGEPHHNKPVNGKDISRGYSWDGKPYTDTKYGQVIDTAIEDIICKQGFDGVPKVMKKEDFDKFLDEHPNMPVMLRTYTAPSKEMLDAYDADLEGGAWYVDCGVGGSAHGQGMYTAYSDEVTRIRDTDDRKLWDEAIEADEFRGTYIYDKGCDHYFYAGFPSKVTRANLDSIDPGQCIIVRDKETGKARILYSTKSTKDAIPERWYDASTEEHFEMSPEEFRKKYDYMAMCSEMDADQVPESGRDLTRPLGQMRMYIDLNEGRVREQSKGTDGWTDRFQIGSMPDMILLSGKEWSKEGTGDKPPQNLSELTEGDYILTHNSKHEGYRHLFVFHVDADGNLVDPSGQHDEDETKEILAKYNTEDNEPWLYTAKTEDVSDREPTTTTRKMTLDPSVRLIDESDVRYKLLSKRVAQMVKNPTEKQLLISALLHKNDDVFDVSDEDIDAIVEEEISWPDEVLERKWNHNGTFQYSPEEIREFVRKYTPEWARGAIFDVLREECEDAYDKERHEREKQSEFYRDVVKDNPEFFEMKAVQQAIKNTREAALRKVKEKYLKDDIMREASRDYDFHLISPRDLDYGVLAAMFGYDGIRCSNYGQTIIVLNRSKLIMSEERVDVPEGIGT